MKAVLLGGLTMCKAFWVKNLRILWFELAYEFG